MKLIRTQRISPNLGMETALSSGMYKAAIITIALVMPEPAAALLVCLSLASIAYELLRMTYRAVSD